MKSYKSQNHFPSNAVMKSAQRLHLTSLHLLIPKTSRRIRH